VLSVQLRARQRHLIRGIRAMEPTGSTLDAGVHICSLAADFLVDSGCRYNRTTAYETRRRFTCSSITGFAALGCNSTKAGRALRLRPEEELCFCMAHAGAVVVLVLSRTSPRLGAWTRFVLPWTATTVNHTTIPLQVPVPASASTPSKTPTPTNNSAQLTCTSQHNGARSTVLPH
jgi:hypothetical protein